MAETGGAQAVDAKVDSTETTVMTGSNSGETNAETELSSTAATSTTGVVGSEQRKKQLKRRNERWEFAKKRLKSSFEASSEDMTVPRDRMRPNKGDIPNKGSYANPAMQKLFGIDVSREKEATEVKRVKKKVALLIAFLGTKYYGFQSNPDVRTIQSEVELALYKAGFLLPSNFGFPHKNSWSNSARTDKGVHACAQVCSLKMEVGTLSDDETRESINKHLPDNIQIMDVKRPSRKFCAHTQRSRVRYQYMIPSFLFFDRNELNKLFDKVGIDKNLENSNHLTEDQISQLRASLSNYRVSKEQLDVLGKALETYEGTHAYQNFTRRIAVGDPSAIRFMLSFKYLKPVIMPDGTEWIPTQVLGQSFLLNQIRKMVSLAVEVVRGTASLDVMSYALNKKNEMRVGTAPAEGLFLEMSDYHQYNQHARKSQDSANLDWIDKPNSPAMQRIQRFKEEKILKTIVEQEASEGNFIKYLCDMERVFDYKQAYKIGNGERLWLSHSISKLSSVIKT